MSYTIRIKRVDGEIYFRATDLIKHLEPTKHLSQDVNFLYHKYKEFRDDYYFLLAGGKNE